MMQMNPGNAPAWLGAYSDKRTLQSPESEMQLIAADYALSQLAINRHLSSAALDEFREHTALADFTWRVMWAGKDDSHAELSQAVRRAHGIVIFIHGWDSSGAIWEELPGMLLARNPDLLLLIPDVNGFGGTPFVSETPDFEQCSPPAAMHAIERWVNLLDLRSPPGAQRQRPFTFVGHSMGGAALFFLDDDSWGQFEVSRVAVAPALLLNDGLRQGFYKALGASIMLAEKSKLLDRLQETLFAPRIIEILVGGASDFVKQVHQQVFETAPEGVIARTFAAMGQLEVAFDKDRWRNFHVFLGHRDRLVGLTESLDLLEELNFEPQQLTICLGDHYFFSIGEQSARLHRMNRALLRDGILAMHATIATHDQPDS